MDRIAGPNSAACDPISQNGRQRGIGGRGAHAGETAGRVVGGGGSYEYALMDSVELWTIPVNEEQYNEGDRHAPSSFLAHSS